MLWILLKTSVAAKEWDGQTNSFKCAMLVIKIESVQTGRTLVDSCPSIIVLSSARSSRGKTTKIMIIITSEILITFQLHFTEE